MQEWGSWRDRDSPCPRAWIACKYSKETFGLIQKCEENYRQGQYEMHYKNGSKKNLAFWKNIRDLGWGKGSSWRSSTRFHVLLSNILAEKQCTRRPTSRIRDRDGNCTWGWRCAEQKVEGGGFPFLPSMTGEFSCTRLHIFCHDVSPKAWSTACPDQMLDSTYLWHQNILFLDLNSNFDCLLPWHIQILEHTHYSPQQWYCLYWDPCAPTQPETTEWGLGKCWSAHAVSSQWKYLVTFENIVDSLKSLVNQWSIMQGIANLSIDQVILCIDARSGVAGAPWEVLVTKYEFLV